MAILYGILTTYEMRIHYHIRGITNKTEESEQGLREGVALIAPDASAMFIFFELFAFCSPCDI